MKAELTEKIMGCLGFLGLTHSDIALAVAHIEHVVDDLVVERDENEAAFKAWHRRCMEAETERDLAITHDRQPYPTAWAYERACEALNKHKLRADILEAAARELIRFYDVDPTDSAVDNSIKNLRRVVDIAP